MSDILGSERDQDQDQEGISTEETMEAAANTASGGGEQNTAGSQGQVTPLRGIRSPYRMDVCR